MSTAMAEWLSNLTAFRDVLLLFFNLGAFACLIAILALLVIHIRQARADRARQIALLESRRGGTPEALGMFKTPRGSPTASPELPPAVWDLLKQNHDAVEKLAGHLSASAARDPEAGLRDLIKHHEETLRQLMSDWNEESEQRRRANQELRDLLRADIAGQAARLRKLLDASPPAPHPTVPSPTPTSGTITASAHGAEESRPDAAWQEEVRGELSGIVDRLERLSERVEEIFQI